VLELRLSLRLGLMELAEQLSLALEPEEVKLLLVGEMPQVC